MIMYSSHRSYALVLQFSFIQKLKQFPKDFSVGSTVPATLSMSGNCKTPRTNVFQLKELPPATLCFPLLRGKVRQPWQIARSVTTELGDRSSFGLEKQLIKIFNNVYNVKVHLIRYYFHCKLLNYVFNFVLTA